MVDVFLYPFSLPLSLFLSFGLCFFVTEVQENKING